MDDLEIKNQLSLLAEAAAHAIDTGDTSILKGFSLNIRKELDEEVKRRRIVAERRNPGTVRELQEKTGMGLYTCKNALESCDWDINKALDFLRRN